MNIFTNPILSPNLPWINLSLPGLIISPRPLCGKHYGWPNVYWICACLYILRRISKPPLLLAGGGFIGLAAVGDKPPFVQNLMGDKMSIEYVRVCTSSVWLVNPLLLGVCELLIQEGEGEYYSNDRAIQMNCLPSGFPPPCRYCKYARTNQETQTHQPTNTETQTNMPKGTQMEPERHPKGAKREAKGATKVSECF